jgi:hypothetical protein
MAKYVYMFKEGNSFKYGVIDSFGNEIFRTWLPGDDYLYNFVGALMSRIF